MLSICRAFAFLFFIRIPSASFLQSARIALTANNVCSFSPFSPEGETFCHLSFSEVFASSLYAKKIDLVEVYFFLKFSLKV